MECVYGYCYLQLASTCTALDRLNPDKIGKEKNTSYCL